ncbi:hypothetical protein [Microcoleus sp. F4-D5]|uniref:hypothetical protein n=1 Tax=Microcoleus sp. F4-D5 TaxID=2818760 RepID=UPI002FD1867B
MPFYCSPICHISTGKSTEADIAVWRQMLSGSDRQIATKKQNSQNPDLFKKSGF